MAASDLLDLQRRKINGTTIGGPWVLGSGSNYIYIDINGNMHLDGSATVWDDVRVPIEATKLQGSKDPGYAVFKTNGAGSQGVFLYWFDASAEEEVYFTLQIPHTYKEGSNIYPHVHWTPKITADGNPANQKVRWGLEYTWSDIGETFGNTTLIYALDHSPADANVEAGKHYMTSFSPISGSGYKISSMLCCRIFRNATSLLDTYEQDAGLLEVDFHIEVDAMGSKEESTK